MKIADRTSAKGKVESSVGEGVEEIDSTASDINEALSLMSS